MSMKTKVGDVVRLDSPHSSYRGNFTAGHIGVVTAIHAANDPWGGHQWVNLDGESGSPLWNPVTNMTMIANSNDGVLFEEMFEDMREGDTLVATLENDDNNQLSAGETYTAVANDCECCFHFLDSDGDRQHNWDDDFWFINLSALKRDAEPVTMAEVIPFPSEMFDPFDLDAGVERIAPLNPKYDDMDNAAKGAILLAAHEGKMIQFMSNSGGFWVDDTSFDVSENFAYRVKPQELIDAEEALNAATSNVVALAEARDVATDVASAAIAAYSSAEFDLASAKDTVEALNAA